MNQPVNESTPLDSSSQVPWTAGAVVVHLALISATVETFRAGSPVRWAAVAAMAAYIGGLAASRYIGREPRRRHTPAALAASGSITLMALVALSAWMSGGLTDGLRLFMVSTTTLLSLVSLAAVTLAGAWLSRNPSLPRALRAGLLILAGYAVVAFLIAIVRGTPYHAAFHGDAVWHRLPFWLQGPFLGAFVVVPAALLAELRDVVRSRRTPWTTRRLIALALSVTTALPAMTISEITSPGVTSPFQAADLARPLLAAKAVLEPLTQAQSELSTVLHGPKAPLTWPARADRLEATFDALGRVVEGIPRDSFDPDVIVAAAGRDPQQLLQWVRTETALVPYPGVLRGPAGVLMDRVGNSLDRALFLADLLKRAGREARLARATLTPQQGDRLASVVQAAHAVRAAPGDDPTEQLANEVLQGYAAKVGGQADAVNGATLKVRRAAGLVGEEVARRAEVQTGVLLRIAGDALGRVAEELKAHDAKALTDYWWVQVNEGGSWVDLDPQEPAWTGSSHPTAETTMLPDQVGDDLRHIVRVSVGIECACGKGLEERPVFNHTFRVSELSGVPVTLKQAPAAAPGSDVLSNLKSAPEMRKWLTAQEEWLSTLVVGSVPVEMARVTSAGVIVPGGLATTPPPPRPSPQGGLLDAFGAGGGDGPPAPADGRLTAEFIDYETRVPGYPASTERRYLFDWLGPRARTAGGSDVADLGSWSSRALALATEVEILILGAQPSSSFATYRAGRDVLGRREPVLRALRQIESVSSIPQTGEGPLDRFPAELYGLATTRRAFSLYGDHVYLAEPNILTRHQVLTGGPATAITHQSAFDIVSNAVRVRPGSGLDPVLVGVNQGILDSNAEVILAAADDPSTNIAEVMAGDTASDHWRVVDRADDGRLKAEVREGRLIIAPSTTDAADPGGAGWWRIDVRRGSVLGVTSKGWGGTQALLEFGFDNDAMALKSMNFIYKMLATCVCILGTAAVALIDLDTMVARGAAQSSVDDRLAKFAFAMSLCVVVGLMTSLGGILIAPIGGVVSTVGNAIGAGAAFGVLVAAIYNYLSPIEFLNP